MDTEATLDGAPRLVLAVRGGAWQSGAAPAVLPVAFWWDGSNVWTTVPAESEEPRLLQEAPHVAAYLPPGRDGDQGLILDGRARLFGAADPVGLLTHAPLLGAAMTALALKEAAAVVARAQAVLRSPTGWMPSPRTIVRVAVQRVREITPPSAPTGGVAPALPSVIAPEVRRDVAGQRQVVLVTPDADGITLLPAVWGARSALTAPKGARPPTSGPATVMILPTRQTHAVTGVALRGRLRAPLGLDADRAVWWCRGTRAAADIPAPGSSVVLPE